MPSSSPPAPSEPHRRALIKGGLVTAAALVTAWPAAATEPEDFAVDWQGGPRSPAIADSLDAQIALVKRLRIKPAIAAFFAAQPIAIDLTAGTHTRAGPRGVFFERSAVPPDKPVLLHELLHRYHLLRLPDGRANATVIRFYDEVMASRQFPPQAYMFTNPFEFFAMTASVALYGHAARPPSTREMLAARAPGLYRWIVDEFGLVT